ncbi:hypothetical protein [Streptomyces sp. NPDC056291]|uniref:hypothetical protein n=1 Tax=Streptomyces sp. NPDC056291 TaxID=3345772 RepID=UPI0035DD0781
MPSAVRSGATVVEGQVRNVQVRLPHSGTNETKETWTFRIERYDNAGNRSLLVPVEMRGITFEGSIHDGDWVRTQGRMRSGTLHVTRLENLTTSATVRVRGVSKAQWIALCIFVLAFLAWVGFLIYDGITSAAKFSGH